MLIVKITVILGISFISQFLIKAKALILIVVCGSASSGNLPEMQILGPPFGPVEAEPADDSDAVKFEDN